MKKGTRSSASSQDQAGSHRNAPATPGPAAVSCRELLERVLAEVLREVPPRERKMLRPRSAYLAETIAELERLPQRGAGAPATPALRRRILQKVLKDLFDPAAPLANQLIVAEAAEIARLNILARKRDRLRHELGDAVVDAGAAASVACDALIELGRTMAAPPDPWDEPVHDPWAFLATIIDRRVTKLHLRALRSSAPGLYARRRMKRRFERAPQDDPPDLGPAPPGELADEQAAAEAAKLGWSEPHSRLDPSEVDIAGPAGVETVENREVVRFWDRLVAKAPFTPTDRETWALLRKTVEEGGSTREIPWPELGVPPHNGSQRLHSLLRKIRRLTDDATGES